MSIWDDIGSVFSVPADAINGTVDFLKWIAWIFHPVNILRAVEFLAGMSMLYMGLRPYLQRSGAPTLASTGAGLQRVVTSALAPTPVGREMRAAQGARMGKREGQRESARMGARRAATRTEREASSRERHERETRNRQAARKNNARKKTS